MAQNSLNIFVDEETLDTLKDVLKGVVENIQVGAVSEAIKNKQGSGDPEGGSITYKRFKNSVLANKGTARQAGAGTPVYDENVIVNMDTDKEIVEELQTKDIKLLGVPELVRRRADNQAKRIVAFLDTAFFANAKSEGTAYDGESTDAKDIIDDLIVEAKSTKSDYIDGIDSMDLAIVLSPTYRKALKNALDELPQGTVAANGAIGMYDGIEVYESVRLPQGVECFVMLKGSIAQPYMVTEYTAEKVPFDDALAVENFLYTGVKALNPEAIYYYSTGASL